MARKAAINQANLTALGAEKLARLVLEASARDSGFKRLVAATLVGASGPKAVAAIIDRKISTLERAKGFVEWDRAKVFAADLDITVKTIVDELGPADPFSAVGRLLRFIATHQAVFERIDDSQGRVQDIYETAIDALRPFVAAMPEAERERLPDMVMTALGRETHGYLPMVVLAVAADLSSSALARWDAALASRQAAIQGKSDGSRVRSGEASLSSVIACRQALAEARGDLDVFIALEEAKHPNLQNTLEIAERLIAAARPTEALQWVRRTNGRRVGYISSSSIADGSNVRDLSSNHRVRLEARILESLGDRAAAQDLRWSSFSTTLDVGMLREHVAHLEDFAEFDVLDRAFDYVSSAAAAYSALTFFIEWPKLDRAAKLVVERHNVWDGRHYHLLLPAAQALEETQPAAATVLYRALLGDILTRGKSPAYAHGAKYLARLNNLAAASNDAAIPNVNTHASYMAELANAHGRKTGFWSQVRAAE